MTAKRTIEIWETEGTQEAKAALPTLGKARIQATQIDISILSENLKQVLTNFQQVLDEQPKSASGYYIDEIELNLGVSGNGSIALIGKLEAGIQAGIKIKLKRETKG
jgi:hypothetical protein